MAKKPNAPPLGQSHSNSDGRIISKWLKALPLRVWNWIKTEIFSSTVIFSVITLLLCVLISLSLYSIYPDYRVGFFEGIFIEFNGMIFDIFVFGIVTAVFIQLTEKNRELTRQREIIDDYKKWDSDEGKLRIAGAVRRINRLGRTDIDFGGLEISKFSFRQHDIRSIKGSTFHDGTWGEMGSRDEVKLERVEFDSVDCSNVVFSTLNPVSGLGISWALASIENCTFRDATLLKAVFNGAHLLWSEAPPETLGDFEEIDDDHYAFHKKHHPPFDGAELSGTSFKDCLFKNVDFREANGVLECEFTGARGLESGIFDDDEIKRQVLELAKKKQ